MYDSCQRFSEKIRYVGIIGNMDNIDAVLNKMSSDVNVLHSGVTMRIMRTRDGALIITEQC